MSAANLSSSAHPDKTNQKAAQQVDQRSCLPHCIQQQLLPMARQDWSKHPSYSGSAAFFIAYHGSLLNTINNLVPQLEELMQHSESGGIPLIQLQPALRSGLYLVEKAHHHHQIEDASYFPQFRQLLPNFGAAIDLLDGDHLVLDAALHNFKKSIQKAYKQTQVSQQYVANLYEQALFLKKVLTRHLHDEEEIIIPIFLKFQ